LTDPRTSGTRGSGQRSTQAPELGAEGHEPQIPVIARDQGDGRHAWLIGGLALALLGGAAASDPVAALGLIVAGVGLLRWISVDRGLRGIVVIRRFERDRVVCGDTVELNLTVRNRDPLPIPWLRVSEALPAELELELVDEPGSDAQRSDAQRSTEIAGESELRNGWSLGPYRRTTRRVKLIAGHRGVHRFDQLNLAAGDLLGRTIGAEDRSIPVTLVVRPRIVGTMALDARHDWQGERATRTGRVDDPSRFAGVRPYTAGDPVRRLHWRATARLGEPVVKRYDPARERDVVIVLDIDSRDETWRRGDGRDRQHEADQLEELCIVAASLARRFEAEGAACGLAAAAFSGNARRIAFVAPSSAAGQSGQIGNTLARLGAFPSVSFPALLGSVAHLVRPGTQIVVVTARDPRPWLATARRLTRSGFALELISLGEAAPEHARAARLVGIAARAVRLDSGWRTSRALELAG
jgi:uncharacterized protein (DUF58 family)